MLGGKKYIYILLWRAAPSVENMDVLYKVLQTYHSILKCWLKKKKVFSFYFSTCLTALLISLVIPLLFATCSFPEQPIVWVPREILSPSACIRHVCSCVLGL